MKNILMSALLAMSISSVTECSHWFAQARQSVIASATQFTGNAKAHPWLTVGAFVAAGVTAVALYDLYKYLLVKPTPVQLLAQFKKSIIDDKNRIDTEIGRPYGIKQENISFSNSLRCRSLLSEQNAYTAIIKRYDQIVGSAASYTYEDFCWVKWNVIEPLNMVIADIDQVLKKEVATSH